jgi:hypothetical protein
MHRLTAEEKEKGREILMTRGKLVYDKYGTKDKISVYSHYVYGKLATCVCERHEMYLREGKILNRRFNYCTHEVLIAYETVLPDAKPRILWIGIESVVCAVRDGSFYKVVEKEPDFRDYAIISGNHPLNGYCCPVVSTTGAGENKRTMVWDRAGKKAMYAPRKWAHTIDYVLPFNDIG